MDDQIKIQSCLSHNVTLFGLVSLNLPLNNVMQVTWGDLGHEKAGQEEGGQEKGGQEKGGHEKVVSVWSEVTWGDLECLNLVLDAGGPAKMVIGIMTRTVTREMVKRDISYTGLASRL